MHQDMILRVQQIRRALEAAAVPRWGRAPQIIAVSKTVDAQRVNAVQEAGIFRLGENRAQEILEKLPHLNASFQIDFIGRLQNNKVKYIIDKVGMIQSLDRMSLAQEIDRRAQQRALRMPVLVQVNIGDEPQKGGVPVSELFAFVRQAAMLPGLEIRGLMAVMPDIKEEARLRPCFVRMRALFDALKEENVAGVRMEELSMGMSGDYLLAAQEGATHVRIGSAIFGARAYGAPTGRIDDTLKGDIYS